MSNRFDDLEIAEITAQINARLHPAHREVTLDEITALVELHLGEPVGSSTPIPSGANEPALTPDATVGINCGSVGAAA